MIDDCWNRIGVRGDRSCPELKTYAHCHNCPVHGAAAAELLREAPSDDSLAERAHRFSQPLQIEHSGIESIVIFRIANEWLALATSVIEEVAIPGPVRSLPHRTSGLILGVVNVRGELLISTSLAHVLGLTSSGPSGGPAPRTASPRWLLLRRNEIRAVCPVDEVHGIHRLDPAGVTDVPATLVKSTVRYSTRLLAWNGRSVGLLDDQLLFYSLKRGFA